jgi:hypothetical protein
MTIKNRDRFPDIDFLPEDEQRIIGDAEGIPLVLLGTEQGSEDMIVARSYSDNFRTEELQPVSVSELLRFTQGAINIQGSNRSR